VASHLNVSKEDLDFTYSACSGAVVEEITQQAEKLSSGQQFIMLSAVCFVGATLCPTADFDLRAGTTPT
jgi:hypothetical protein